MKRIIDWYREGVAMNRRTAIETASTLAVKDDMPYVVGFDKVKVDFVYGPLRSFFVKYPDAVSDGKVLCTPDGEVKDV